MGLSRRSALLLASALVLGISLQITQGFYSPAGIGLLALSLILCAAATIGPKWLDHPFASAALPENAVVGVSLFVILLLVQVYAGVRTIFSVPQPNNDVWVFHTNSALALEQRINPYTITFPNIYHPDAWVYAPEVVHDDRLLFGYPYPPLTLLLTTAGHTILGDCRYAMLLAIALTGILIVAIRPDWMGLLIATVFLYTPTFPFVLEMGWTEPLQAMLWAAVVFCVMWAPKLAGIMLGLLIASKQYLPATLLLLPLLYLARGDSPRAVARDLQMTFIVAIAVTLPFALWDFESFIHSVVTLQLHQPFRKDALSFLNLWRAGREGWIGPSWVSFVAMAIAIALCYWRRAGFASAFAFMFFMFFAFNKQAFANYYYLIVAALCLAAAADGLNREHGSTDKS